MKDGREGNQMVFPNTFEDGEDSMMPYSPDARAPTGIFCMSAVFLRFLLHFTLYFRNPVDATLSPLSNFRYSRWPPANRRTIQLNIILLLCFIIMPFLSLHIC